MKASFVTITNIIVKVTLAHLISTSRLLLHRHVYRRKGSFIRRATWLAHPFNFGAIQILSRLQRLCDPSRDALTAQYKVVLEHSVRRLNHLATSHSYTTH